ncbi:hypothetical protein GGF41_000440 [Coemansia sp. RSA 2531]|nr:hypothetical protein GGF41_000440 [Coemansia sp. RSA 2531]
MTALSLFQTLPMSIVDKVVEYLEGRSRNFLDPNLMKYIESKKVLLPLLCVSQHWRAAALSLVCNSCEVEFDYTTKGFEATYPALPEDFPFSQYRGQNLVKRVLVCAPNMNEIYGGDFSSTPSQPKPDFPIFPLATKLVVFQVKNNMSPPIPGYGGFPACCDEPVDRNKVTVEYARTLRRLAPAATDIILSFDSLGSTDKKNRGLYNVLVTELFSGAIVHLHVESRTGPPLPSFKLNAITQLTCIRQGANMACTPFAQLAYENTRTLQELSIRLKAEADWHTLIYGGKSTSAVYSSLTSLAIKIVGIPCGTFCAAIEDAAPFPALRKLDVSSPYTFDDDLFFRGNGKTLQNLNIPYGAVDKNIFGRFGVLERNGVTQMNSIAIGVGDDEDYTLVAEHGDAHIVQQVQRMANVARTLSVGYDTADALVYKSILATSRAAIIQHFEYRCQPLDTANILDIISFLPCLVSLTCRVKGSVPNIEAISASEYPMAIFAKNYHRRISFRKLVILGEYADYDDRDEMARAIAVIAVHIIVPCFNFRHVDLASDLRTTFSREIAWAVVNPPFMQYAASLRRLVYRF